MKGEQCCGNCRFFDAVRDTELVNGERVRGGVCRFNPPVALTELQSCRPTVHTKRWCGQWQAENPSTVDECTLALARQRLAGDLTAGRALVDRVAEMIQEGQA